MEERRPCGEGPRKKLKHKFIAKMIVFVTKSYDFGVLKTKYQFEFFSLTSKPELFKFSFPSADSSSSSWSDKKILSGGG